MVDFATSVLSDLVSSLLFKYVVVPLIMTSVFGGILHFAFNKLNELKQAIAFGVGSFVLFAILMVIGARPQQPQLNGTIQNVLAGQVPGNDRDTMVVFTINIINTGSMQTIVKNWRVEASANNRKYDAVFPPMPNTLTFNNIPHISPEQPEQVTYKVQDNILEKALVPIQVGAILPGVLYVVFQNVDSSVFKSGIDFKVAYEDVLSKQYTMAISSSGKMDTIGVYPGVHTEMVCPVPPKGLPKLGNDITSSITPNASPVPATKPATSP